MRENLEIEVSNVCIEGKRAHSDFLMRLLSISALLNNGHNNVLRCHEGKLLSDPTSNDLRVDNHTLRHVLEGRQHDVCSEECFGERDPTVRTDREMRKGQLIVLGLLTCHQECVQTTERLLSSKRSAGEP